MKTEAVFFLNENYAPARLVEVPSVMRYVESKHAQVLPEVLPYLERMFFDANASHVPLYIYSAYRSYNTQEALKGAYRRTYGEGLAQTAHPKSPRIVAAILHARGRLRKRPYSCRSASMGSSRAARRAGK